jgi:hypothetical protein
MTTKKQDKNNNKKKKLNKQLNEYELTINKFHHEFVNEIDKVLTHKNELRNTFYTIENKYEKLQLPDTADLKKNTSKTKLKNYPFDIHIKNVDDYAYERIVLD